MSPRPRSEDRPLTSGGPPDDEETHYRLGPGPEGLLRPPALPALPCAGVPPGRKEPSRFGDYELLGEVASGGMGVVFKARHVAGDRVVALKMIRDSALATPQSVERF